MYVVEDEFVVNAKVVLPVIVSVYTPEIAASISCRLTFVMAPHVPEFSPVACKFKPKLLNVPVSYTHLTLPTKA